MIAKRKST